MKIGPAPPLHALALPLALVSLVAGITGCARPLRMSLAFDTRQEPGYTIWWRADDDQGLRPPIVGIEHCCSSQRSRQIVFCDRGVRIFRYRGGQLVGAGPPLPGRGGDADIELVRAALHHYRANPAAVGHAALPALPPGSIAAIQSVQDVADLLEERWSGVRVKPPFGLSYRQIDAELEYFPHGIVELYKASKAF